MLKPVRPLWILKRMLFLVESGIIQKYYGKFVLVFGRTICMHPVLAHAMLQVLCAFHIPGDHVIVPHKVKMQHTCAYKTQ